MMKYCRPLSLCALGWRSVLMNGIGTFEVAKRMRDSKLSANWSLNFFSEDGLYAFLPTVFLHFFCCYQQQILLISHSIAEKSEILLLTFIVYVYILAHMIYHIGIAHRGSPWKSGVRAGKATFQTPPASLLDSWLRDDGKKKKPF